MAIKIHWGSNGSYKTAGAVMDDIIPAILEGRTIITNIRGLTSDRALKVFPDAPNSLEIINLDLDSVDGLSRCRNWFMWAPKGALIVFDEAQLVFLKSWREKDLAAFDYPGGIEEAAKADRPSSFLDAFTRHRHFNWDVVLTTPNIKMIHSNIRETTETAFKHTNYALLGPIFKKLIGDYKEVFHDAQLNQPAPKSIQRNRRISKKVFKLYDSTSTGVIKDTRAGTSVFASIPLLIGLFVCISAIAYSVLSGGYGDLLSKSEAPSSFPIQSNTSQVISVSDDSTGRVQHDTVDHLESFISLYDIKISGHSNINNTFVYHLMLFKDGFEPLIYTSSELEGIGFDLEFFNDCFAVLTYKTFKKSIPCFVAPNSNPLNDKVESYALN